MFKDLVRALSTANLCFILTWDELINASIRRFNTCLGVIINVLLLGALFWALITLSRRVSGQRGIKIAQLLFLLVLLLPINGITIILFPRIVPFNTVIILGLAVAIIGLFEIAPWYGYILRTGKILVTILFPFFLLSMSQASWSLISTTVAPDVQAKAVEGRPTRRVLWLIFDEMDQHLAFSNRPETLSLPELDRLRNEGIYAPNVFPPSDSTSVSLPALITGKLLSNTEVVNRHTLLVTFGDSNESVNWDSRPNVFSDAREAGYNTALIGWFLPYCSMIGRSLTECAWIDTEAATLSETMVQQVRGLISLAPLVSYVAAKSRESLRRDARIKAIDSYRDTLQAAKKAIADSTLGFVLVHWPVPHPPNIYDRQRNELEIDRDRSYLDNLSLVDQALGELRLSLESAGSWENTIVLVTSDHCWRPEIWRPTELWSTEDAGIVKSEADYRVPFILKLPGQQHGVVYEPVFNSVLSRDLLMGLLRGELSSVESVTRWLDEHKSIGPSPYRFNLPN